MYRARTEEALIANGLVVIILLVWWGVSLRVPEFVLPAPQNVALRVLELFVHPAFLYEIGASVTRVFASVILALIIGSLLAFIGFSSSIAKPVIEKVITPFASAFPSIAWAILGAIWLGTGNEAVMFVQTAILVPFCLINISEGFRQLDRELLEMGKSFSKSLRRNVILLTIPLLIPYAIAGLRISYGIGWKVALVAELMGAPSGIGQIMFRSQMAGDATTTFACCFVIVALFLVGDRLVLRPMQERFGK